MNYEGKRPNILFISTDQQRWDTIAALGNKYVRTPNLDRLVKCGVSFNRTYCQCPVCQPSRASFMSGLYPQFLHVVTNEHEFFPDSSLLLSRRLADNGYTCGLSGKLHVGCAMTDARENMSKEYGFSYYKYVHSPMEGQNRRNDYYDWLRAQGVEPNDIFHINAKGRNYGYTDKMKPEYHANYWCVTEGINFIKQQKHSDKPWLLCVNIFDPHPAYEALPEYLAHYNHDDLPDPYYYEGEEKVQEKMTDDVAYHQTKTFWGGYLSYEEIKEKYKKTLANYYGMVEHLDHEIGRLFDYIEENKLSEDTAIVFASDHGDMMGDHLLMRKGCRFYEDAVRVPLIFSWKGHFEEGKVYDFATELTDICPTIEEICSLDSRMAHGESLLPVLLGEQKKRAKKYARCEHFDIREKTHCNATMYVEGDYKLIIYHGSNFGELFDLKNDPHELKNLYFDSKYEKVRTHLTFKMLDSLMVNADFGKGVGEYEGGM